MSSDSKGSVDEPTPTIPTPHKLHISAPIYVLPRHRVPTSHEQETEPPKSGTYDSQ